MSRNEKNMCKSKESIIANTIDQKKKKVQVKEIGIFQDKLEQMKSK